MKKQWQTVMKPAFVNYLQKLTGKEVLQVIEKVTMLEQDPRPDGWVKKQLSHLPGRPYRIRSGKYRIFYTFNLEFVAIYKMDERDDDTYDDTDAPDVPPSADALAGLDMPMGDASTTTSPQPDWERTFSDSQCRPLPEPLTLEILNKLQIPSAYHTRLLRIKDEDELLACPGVAEEVLLKIDDYMFERPLIQVMQEPDLILNDADDLLRYKDGELLAFLLKLSPEQEKYASWSLTSTGPTLVKGGPGTGKSTVALYRIRSLLTQLLKKGAREPKILFTTYTNALVKSSEQLLQQLLGTDFRYVRVETTDSIAYAILQDCKEAQDYEIQKNEVYKQLLAQAIAETCFEGNLLQQKAQKQTLQRMGIDYLLEELNSIIVARQLTTVEMYLQTPRTGRKLRLHATQRNAIWSVYQNWTRILAAQGLETFQQRRARAVERTSASSYAHYFDAVVIDEAQDLDPTALRMLVKVCQSSNRLFVTADANQSIYGGSFSWSDVNENLKFQGRTNILHANYRSTFEIGEAAQSYLSNGTLETDSIERHYINNGPMPDARRVQNQHYEAHLLVSYFKKASRSLRHSIGSCAVLCPSEKAGQALATALQNQGLEATYMAGRELNLTRPGVKVMTLKSSKGLEFPIVALAGFTPNNYPKIPSTATAEEIEELLARERRTMFVGMTRAMRALLVIMPNGYITPLFNGFDPDHWNFNRTI